MKEFKIWCDACGKETDGILKITITDNFAGTRQDLDMCEDCFQKFKGMFIELTGNKHCNAKGE